MKKNKTTKIAKVLMYLVISMVLISCEDTIIEPEADLFEIQGENGFVGTVNGTNAFISLLVAHDEAIVYVCNGDEEIHEWFRGDISDPTKISLTNSAGAQVSAQFAGTSIEGDVTLSNNSTFTFIATPNNTDDAGIFRVMGDEASQDEIAAAWILKSEEDQRGAFIFRSFFQSAPRFHPTTDGSSNTILVGELRKEKSYPVFRFSINWHPDSLTVIQVNR